ncbi:hypothetical protein J437_LFUL008006 [Ladona fulva]|uniref:C2H2-type domain-containing protein n=1 Tax=Ladona fulva TaxID=123851 RepID=A0A8K0K3M7_LADFU|nr:hypothetical protein J437_LFUL008006 [Ladona fulva]
MKAVLPVLVVEAMEAKLVLGYEFCLCEVSTNDSLSHLICHRCLYKVDEFYQFKISCLKSNAVLTETKKLLPQTIDNASNTSWEENCVDRKSSVKTEMETSVNSSSVDGEENPEERQDPEISQPCLAPSNLVVALLEDEENAGPGAQAPFQQGEMEGNPWFDRSNSGLEKPFQVQNLTISTLKAFNFRDTNPPYRSRTPKKRKTGENSDRNNSVVKKYPCDHCHMSFNFRSNLLRHERVHSGERPFKCTICSKSFSQNEHLVRHDRVHSKEKQALQSLQAQES